VNTNTTDDQAFPAVAADAGGDFVVVWHSSGQADSYGVFGQRYTNAGAPVGAEFQVDSYATLVSVEQTFPAVAADADGGFVAVWVSASGGQDGDGPGVFGQRLQPVDSVSELIGDGGTATSDTESDGATAQDPVETSVTSPAAGTVSILEQAAIGGFYLAGQAVTITAPGATVGNPLVVVFELDASVIPAGGDQNSIELFRDAVAVPACTGTAGTADPDPCIPSRVLQGDGDVEITVLTSSASLWTFAVQSVPPMAALSLLGWCTFAGLLSLTMVWTRRCRAVLGVDTTPNLTQPGPRPGTCRHAPSWRGTERRPATDRGPETIKPRSSGRFAGDDPSQRVTDRRVAAHTRRANRSRTTPFRSRPARRPPDSHA